MLDHNKYLGSHKQQRGQWEKLETYTIYSGVVNK